VKHAAAISVNSSPENGRPTVLPLNTPMSPTATATRKEIISIMLRSTERA
jgi:hypothetical protein